MQDSSRDVERQSVVVGGSLISQAIHQQRTQTVQGLQSHDSDPDLSEMKSTELNFARPHRSAIMRPYVQDYGFRGTAQWELKTPEPEDEDEVTIEISLPSHPVPVPGPGGKQVWQDTPIRMVHLEDHESNPLIIVYQDHSSALRASRFQPMINFQVYVTFEESRNYSPAMQDALCALLFEDLLMDQDHCIRFYRLDVHFVPGLTTNECKKYYDADKYARNDPRSTCKYTMLDEYSNSPMDNPNKVKGLLLHLFANEWEQVLKLVLFHRSGDYGVELDHVEKWLAVSRGKWIGPEYRRDVLDEGWIVSIALEQYYVWTHWHRSVNKDMYEEYGQNF